MYDNLLFGTWLKNRRTQLDLTRKQLADKVGCSSMLIYKIEVSERRPSKQIALILAHVLQIPDVELDSFIRFARQSDSSNINFNTSVKGITPLITPLIGREAELVKIEDMLFV